MAHARPVPRTIRPDHYEKNVHVLYRCFSRRDVLLYIGMTNNPCSRFHQHRMDKPWWKYVYYLIVEDYPCRRSLAAAEALSIRNERPKFNNIFYDDGQYRRHTKRGQPLWPEASNFGTRQLDHSDLINMTLEQQLYPCVECHARAIYNEGETVACSSCSVEWTFDQWFHMTFNGEPNTPHQLRLL